MDAELGILLRRIETSGGELVTLTELADVTMNPPQPADPARFAPPPAATAAKPWGRTGRKRSAVLAGPPRTWRRAASAR